jgi:hypothetical protein
MRRLAIVVSSLLVLAACSKPKPSTDYVDAQAKWDSLTTRMGDDAYANPEMDQVVAQLDRVPATSSDAAAAQALKAKIAGERTRIAEDQKRREADLAVLRAPIPSSPDSLPPSQPPPPAPPKPTDPVLDSSQPQGVSPTTSS